MSGNNAKQAPHYVSIPAGSDLSTKEKYFVKTSSGKLAVAGAGDAIAGVLDDKPNADLVPGRVQIAGIALVKAGGTCTRDLGAASDASGLAVNAAGSARTVGMFLDTGGTGDYVRVLLGAIATAQASDYESITTSTALNLSIPTSFLTVADTLAFTLAAGTTVGQRKYVECVAVSGTPLGTLTLADADGTEPLTHVFTAVGQRLDLEWRSTGWKVIGKRRSGRQAVVVGTTVLTGYDMCTAYDLSVTGTVHSTSTKGIPNGQIAGERIHIDVLTAAITATGDIDITAKSTVGVACTNWGSTGTSLGSAGTATTAVFTGYWDGSAWQAEVVTTATLA